jgi:glyoxylase-like metal-dependent hydrolase (beta-lactamase superfamily II)
MKPVNQYADIRLDDNLGLTFADSRQFLRGIGIEGEIIGTPGHSDDSITLVLDEGIAFTGDLLGPQHVADEARPQAELSWSKIRSHHVKTIYPGHGPIRPFI